MKYSEQLCDHLRCSAAVSCCVENALTHILTHTENLQSHLAGALCSARWLYAFVLIPFYCFQQRKM